MILDEDIDIVKSQVNMKMLAGYFGIRVNHNGMALCPFHSDKNPSMKVRSGFLDNDGFNCWSCGAGGTIFNFVMDYCNMSFEESVKYIADAFSIPVSSTEKVSVSDRRKCIERIRKAEVDAEIKSKCDTAIKVLSEKIRFYEDVRRFSYPYGKTYCYVSDMIPILKYQWDMLFESIYGRKGKRYE